METHVGIEATKSASGRPSNGRTDEPIRTTRVDQGHVASNGGAASAPSHAEESISPTTGAHIDAVLAADDVHTLVGAQAWKDQISDERAELDAHARQLGLELEHRQAELDAREEELNRNLAEFDQEMRRSRLWLSERRCEIEEREVEIGARRADVEARWERILEGERQLQAARRDRGDDGAATAADCTSDRGVPDVPETAFVPVADSAANDTELTLRARRLDEAEALLAAEHEALAEAKRRAEEDRVAWRAIREAERQSWDEERARQEAALARRHETLGERSRQLDARAESLEQLRTDLAAAQRETLEIRVAVQELWLQLSGRIPAAAAMQSLAEARAKLSAHYRDAGGAFVETERRLRQSAGQLAEQLAQVKEQRRQFQAWADERQAAIERQAARLVAREQELEAQDQRHREQERSWSEQRLAYRREIRRLHGQLGGRASIDTPVALLR
jgi:hypothetical protein